MPTVAPAVSDLRSLRDALEAAQAEVKRLRAAGSADVVELTGQVRSLLAKLEQPAPLEARPTVRRPAKARASGWSKLEPWEAVRSGLRCLHPQRLELVAVEGPSAGFRQVVAAEQFVVGARSDVPVKLDDDRVSRHHLFVQRRNGHVMLEDLGASNGTFVRRCLTQPDAVELLLGDTVLRLRVLE